MPQIQNYRSATSQCDDCRSIYNDDQLEEIDNFFMRVEAGGEVPSGQCPNPECGALCYPITLRPGNQESKPARKSPGLEFVENVKRLAKIRGFNFQLKRKPKRKSRSKK